MHIVQTELVWVDWSELTVEMKVKNDNFAISAGQFCVNLTQQARAISEE